MDTKPFISVVIPAYNEEKYLPGCLDTLNKQTYPRESFEIIVVDNNSKDKTAQIAKDKGAKVYQETEQGYIFALNRGLQEAKGEIIAVTDCDTEVTPAWLTEIAKGFADPKVVGATGNMKVKEKSPLVTFLSSSFYNWFVRANFLVGKPHIAGFNLAVRSRALKEVGGVDKAYTTGGDVDLGLRLKKVGKVVFLNKAWTHASMRRFDKSFTRALREFGKAYIWTVWLRRSPGIKLNTIR